MDVANGGCCFWFVRPHNKKAPKSFFAVIFMMIKLDLSAIKNTVHEEESEAKRIATDHGEETDDDSVIDEYISEKKLVCTKEGEMTVVDKYPLNRGCLLIFNPERGNTMS